MSLRQSIDLLVIANAPILGVMRRAIWPATIEQQFDNLKYNAPTAENNEQEDSKPQTVHFSPQVHAVCLLVGGADAAL